MGAKEEKDVTESVENLVYDLAIHLWQRYDSGDMRMYRFQDLSQSPECHSDLS